MNWLTQKQIKAAAKAGKLEALECSLEHWMQLTIATAEELRKARDKNIVAIEGDYCALCVRYGVSGILSSQVCPLALHRYCSSCCKEWRKAMDEYYTSIKAFRKAATPLKQRLRAEIRKAKKELK